MPNNFLSAPKCTICKGNDGYLISIYPGDNIFYNTLEQIQHKRFHKVHFSCLEKRLKLNQQRPIERLKKYLSHDRRSI